MSSFIVRDDLIDAIVTFAMASCSSIEILYPDAYGQMFVDENYKRFNGRYPREQDKPHRYQFKAVPGVIAPWDAVSVIDCLDYQCSEPAADGSKWKQTKPYQHLNLLRQIALGQIRPYPGPTWNDYCNCDGYRGAADAWFTNVMRLRETAA